MTPSQFAAFTLDQLKTLKPAIADSVTPDQIDALTVKEVKALSSSFRKAVLKDFTAEEESELTSKILKALKTK